MNEAQLVAAIQAEAAATLHPRIKLGIGDDAAVWQPSRSHRSVVSTDALVDGVHFLSAHVGPESIGHKALAVNLSDLAAMGARPVLVTVALALAPQHDEAWVQALYTGLSAYARATKTAIVGGDLVRAAVTMISLTVVGEVSSQRLALRSGAKPGDILAVTGPLGASCAGLAVLQRGATAEALTPHEAAVLHRHTQPQARLREGAFLAASQALHAMIDLSDGIATDLRRLADASRCGALITHVPVAQEAAAVACVFSADADDWALGGGEDYELLAAFAPRAFATTAKAFRHRFRRELITIGTCTVEPEIRRERNGTHMIVPATGWDHFAPVDGA